MEIGDFNYSAERLIGLANGKAHFVERLTLWKGSASLGAWLFGGCLGNGGWIYKDCMIGDVEVLKNE